MSAGHTKGPWRSTGLEYEPETGWFVREAGEGRYLAVAAVRSTHRNREEIEANARLIAAAPDLLEASQELLRLPIACPDADIQRVLGMFLHAVARATGEQP